VLDWSIRGKGWWWSLVPLAGRHRFASTLRTVIYLPPRLYQLHESGTPTLALKDLLRHEQVHVRQWRKEGRRFAFKYVVSRKWRLRYEVEAYAEQCRWNPTPKRIALYARWLSSWRYLWLGHKGDIEAAIREQLQLG